MRSFYLETIPDIGACAELDRRDKRHLFKTLRAKTGEEIELINGAGTTAVAEIQADESLRICRIETVPAPELRICLAVAVPRRQKMDMLLRQCTELGVTEIVPLICERSVAIPEKSDGDERWQTLLIESCKQSRNPFMPRVTAPVKLADFLAAHDWTREPAWFGHPYDENVPETDIPIHHTRWWIVGPEGGFSDAEVEKLLTCGIRPQSLSPYILRVETAAIVGAAWLRNHAEGTNLL